MDGAPFPPVTGPVTVALATCDPPSDSRSAQLGAALTAVASNVSSVNVEPSAMRARVLRMPTIRASPRCRGRDRTQIDPDETQAASIERRYPEYASTGNEQHG